MVNRRSSDNSKGHTDTSASQTADLLGISRESVPDTRALQASILATTRTMPQQFNAKTADPVNSRPWIAYLFRPKFLATAACVAVVATTASLLLPVQPSGDFSRLETAEILSPEELEFQELMLLEDDLLFAQL